MVMGACRNAPVSSLTSGNIFLWLEGGVWEGEGYRLVIEVV